MRTITQKIDIFKFDELADSIKKGLIEQEIESQNELYCQEFLESDMEEKARELLQKYFKNHAIFKNVYYDLSYCQGSGAMIEFELDYYNYNFTISQYGHYFHARSFMIEHDYQLTDKRYEQLKLKIIEMNEELTKYGYNLIENVITEAEAIEILQENEYLKDGIIF